jgi:hypothetical protein
MPLAILAFVFGVLLFLMSTATLALEAQTLSFPWLAWLVLVVLHAAAGFLVLGGPSAYAEGRWGVAAGSAGASLAATTIAAAAALHLAGACHLAMSSDMAMLTIASALAAGLVGVAAAVLHSRRLLNRA